MRVQSGLRISYAEPYSASLVDGRKMMVSSSRMSVLRIRSSERSSELCNPDVKFISAAGRDEA